MANKKTKNAKLAKGNKKTAIEKEIDKLEYKPSQRNWEDLIKRANNDVELAKRIGKSWLFWAKERRKA